MIFKLNKSWSFSPARLLIPVDTCMFPGQLVFQLWVSETQIYDIIYINCVVDISELDMMMGCPCLNKTGDTYHWKCTLSNGNLMYQCQVFQEKKKKRKVE